MKKITTILFIALTVLGSLPIFAVANTNLTSEFSNLVNSSAIGSGYYRIYGKQTDEFTVFLYEGHTDILISGDGSTDLDLYVYDGEGNRRGSQSNSDDEKVCLNPIVRRGYFTIRVVNRGSYANDYRLTIK